MIKKYRKNEVKMKNLITQKGDDADQDYSQHIKIKINSKQQTVFNV